MTKIKNFRIFLRSREIARLLKNREGIPTTPDLEASIEQAIKESKRFLETAALFTTLSKAIAQKTTPLLLADSATAVSLIAATVGPKLEEERAAALAANEPARASLLAALQEEALHQSVQFAVKLISEQAKEEECDVSALFRAEDLPADGHGISLLPPLAALLGIQRIGLPFDGNAPCLPPYSRLVWTLWTPAAKSSSRRSDASARQAVVTA
jgi:hypothetical protein